jgi:hypothetical protein
VSDEQLRCLRRRLGGDESPASRACIAGLLDRGAIRLWSLVFGPLVWSLVVHLSGLRTSLPVLWFWITIRFAEVRRQPQVPNTNRPLPIQCPKCQHNGSRLVVRSLTVMSLTCANCGHFWAADMESLPPEIQEKIPDALRDL